MGRQLERAKQLGGLLNRFGHSVDSFEEIFSAEDAAREALEICRRWAELRRCTLAIESTKLSSFTFRGSRFFFIHLICRVVQLALEVVPMGVELVLILSREDGTCSIVMAAKNLSAARDQESLRVLCEACGGKVHAPEEGRISIMLPEALPQVP